MDHKNKKLGLFFTIDVSVKTWYKSGLLEREKKIYEFLIENNIFDNIFWFTYGPEDEIFTNSINEKIKIIPKPKFFKGIIGSYIYSLLIVFLQKKYIMKCDVLKTNQMFGAWSAVFAKWLYKKPLYIRTGFTLSRFFKFQSKIIKYLISSVIEKIVYKSADIASTTSIADQQYVKKKYHINDAFVVNNYVDTNIFKKQNLPKNKDIIYIGRLDHQKNLYNLMKAIKKTNYKLDIYGEGPLKQSLKKYSVDNNINVHFNDNVSHEKLPAILNQYKICVLCSYYEGMPKTLIEAMSCGLACLGTDVLGIQEVIKHQHNGWLVSTNFQDISDGITRLMNNSNLQEKLSQNAINTIQNHFSLSFVCQQEIQIYKKLFAN